MPPCLCERPSGSFLPKAGRPGEGEFCAPWPHPRRPVFFAGFAPLRDQDPDRLSPRRQGRPQSADACRMLRQRRLPRRLSLSLWSFRSLCPFATRSAARHLRMQPSGEFRPGKPAFPAPFQGANAPPAAAFRGRRRGRPERTARCTYAAGARAWPPAQTPPPRWGGPGPSKRQPRSGSANVQARARPRERPIPVEPRERPIPVGPCERPIPRQFIPPSPDSPKGKDDSARGKPRTPAIRHRLGRREGRPRRRPGNTRTPGRSAPAPKAAGAKRGPGTSRVLHKNGFEGMGAKTPSATEPEGDGDGDGDTDGDTDTDSDTDSDTDADTDADGKTSEPSA